MTRLWSEDSWDEAGLGSYLGVEDLPGGVEKLLCDFRNHLGNVDLRLFLDLRYFGFMFN